MDAKKNQDTNLRRRETSSKSHQKHANTNGVAAIKNTASRDQFQWMFWCLLAAVLILGFLLVGINSRCRADRKCHECITNEADLEIKDTLDKGDELFNLGHLQVSMATFSDVLVKYPNSPRALWGYARALTVMSREPQNKALLMEAVTVMYDVINLPDVPRDLMKQVVLRLAEYGIFKDKASLDSLWTFLKGRFAHDIEMKHVVLNELRRYPDTLKHAERYLKEMISSDPEDCLSMAILGRFYSTKYPDQAKGAELLQRAIDLDCNGIRTVEHYRDLSTALVRLGLNGKATSLHSLGAERGIFLSRDQRSSHNAATPLAARPWWTYEQLTYERDLKLLEDNWEVIRDEGMSLLKDKKRYKDESVDLLEKGRWQQLILYHNGRRIDDNCKKAPKTCKLLAKVPDANTLTRGQIKYSVLNPGTHLLAHCGPTNCRIRAHLGLQIPEGPKIRVGNTTATWKEGKFIIFDDSFEHEVWFNETEGVETGSRLVLIVDFWHPDITLAQRRTMKPCF